VRALAGDSTITSAFPLAFLLAARLAMEETAFFLNAL
jgi:hypothetical protein